MTYEVWTPCHGGHRTIRKNNNMGLPLKTPGHKQGWIVSLGAVGIKYWSATEGIDIRTFWQQTMP